MKTKERFLINKRFILSTLAIMLPVALQNIISYGVNLMDSVMLGKLGDNAISSANLGGQPFFLLTMFCFGIASGGSVLIAQYWGKGEMGQIRKVTAFSLQLAFVVSLLFTAISIIFSKQLLSLFTKNNEIIEMGSDYLEIISIGYVFYSLSNCYLTSLRGVEKVSVSMVIYGISFVVNVVVNYIFIFGKFGAPALGVKGAAIGTVVARVSEFIASIFYMYVIEKRMQFKLVHLFKSNKDIIKSFLITSLPVVGNEVLWGLGTVVLTLIISNISDTFIAAGSIAAVINQIALVGIMGVASASAVLTGKTVGEGDKQKVQKVADTMILFSVFIGLFGTAILFALKGVIISIYDITEEASVLTSQLITILALIQPVLALDIVCIVGVLRGGGDTKVAFVIDCSVVYLYSLPLGALAGFVFGFPAWAVYLILRSDTFIKAILGLIRVGSKKWHKDVVTKTN